MNKIKKEYLVNVDMRWSIDYEVKACSEQKQNALHGRNSKRIFRRNVSRSWQIKNNLQYKIERS